VPFVKIGRAASLSSTETIQHCPHQATEVESRQPNGWIRDEVVIGHICRLQSALHLDTASVGAKSDHIGFLDGKRGGGWLKKS